MDLPKFILLLLVTFVGSSVQEGPDVNEVVPPPVVQIANGKVQGLISSSSSGETVYEFRGIPYGNIPNRFEESEEYSETWGDEPRDATEFGPRCKQLNFIAGAVEGEEDCLFLNVYSRNIDKSAKLPVIFWIHGGRYILGYGDQYIPEPLLDEEVVVVTINYRLGPLGFLNAGVKESPGNQAFKDMVLALKWVQKNIESFGGDKDLVTIFGESAGAGSVSFLMLSPAARGLFSRAIAQSGSTNNIHWSYMQDPQKIATKFAQRFDCPTSNPQYMVECLRRIEADQLLQILLHEVIDLNAYFTSGEIYFAASRETGYISPNVFLEQDPAEIQKSGAMNKVPLLTGVQKDEGRIIGSFLISTTPNFLERLNSQKEAFVSKYFRYKESAKYKCHLTHEVLEEYFPGVDIISQKHMQSLHDMISDMFFIPGVRRSAIFHSNTSTPTYLYHFSLRGENAIDSGFIKPGEDGLFDPTHGDELPYSFEVPDFFGKIEKTERMTRDRTRMVKLIVSFAKNGKPTALWGDSLKDWPEFDPNDPKWVNIDEDMTLVKEEDLFGNRMTFWESFYDKIY